MNPTKKARTNLLNYIAKSENDQQTKTAITEDVREENNLFYLCYPVLFAATLDKDVEKLSISGWMYYQYLLRMDQLSDTSNNGNIAGTLHLATTYHEESIKLLTLLFTDNRHFWTVW